MTGPTAIGHNDLVCGRYASFRESQDLADAFDVVEMTDAARAVLASWNVAPTDDARIVVERQRSIDGDQRARAQRQLHRATWGLIPSWAKERRVGARMINARRETLDSKPAFARAAATKRCLVLADGYYEWKRTTNNSHTTKTPYFISPSDGSPLAFAGLYSWWRDPERDDQDPDRWVLSTTIVTTGARDGLEQIHDREPLMLTADLIGPWLDPDITSLAEVDQMLRQPGPPMSWHEVGSAVGNVRNNSAELILPR